MILRRTRILLALIMTLSVFVRADEVPPAPPPGITLNFQNTDIDLVLKFFSDITGNTFIKSDDVRGFVTVMAPGRVTPTEAMEILQAVLDIKGYTMLPGPGKMIKVLSQAEATQSDLEVGASGVEIPASDRMVGDRMVTQVISLKFVAAQDLKTEVAPLLSKGGNLIADERMNALVITDMASNIRRLIKMIDNLDVRTPQVLIEALIMEVSLTDETKFGVEWGDKLSFHGSDHRFDSEISQGFDVPSLVTEGLKYSVLRDDLKLTATLQALATDKDVNILSTPHIMTVNNQTATIRVGEEVPVLTQTRNIQGGETIRSFDFKSVAIELEVTPRINPDREVYLKVHPLVKKILGFNTELNAPILATREAQTSVILKDGQTIVIGGLMKDDRSLSESKIPILGDIPLIGFLFKSHDTTREKTELLVFITPHVILNPDEARDLTIQKESEIKNARTPFRTNAREHFRTGNFYYREKRYPEAIDELETAISLSPDKNLKLKAGRLLEKAKKKAFLPNSTPPT